VIPRPRYPGLFLVALVTSAALWYATAGQHRAKVSVRSTKANLTLVNLPRSLVLTSSVPDTVTLQIRGPLSLGVDPGLEVFLDLRDARPGRQSYSVDTTRTRLPAEVAVVSVEPAEVELALERLESRPLPVVVPVEGDPAPGSVVGTVQVIPPRLTVEGPESAIAGITSLPTTPVFIDGVAQSFQTTVEVVAVDPPLRLVDFAQVSAQVEIVPEPTPSPTPTPEPRRRR
jgi:YbbR domain-containing protein